MIKKVQYQTGEERATIIEQNSHLFLIEEQNVTEGDFLIFTDTPPIEFLLKDIANTLNLLLLKQEGIL